MVLRK